MPAETSEEQIRVVLVDDHEMIRAGLRGILDRESDISVVGEASSVDEAISVIRLRTPDIAVVDLRLLDGSGLSVIGAIQEQGLKTKPIVLTTFPDDEAIMEAAELGAQAYVLKRSRSDELIEAVRKVAGGASLIDRAMVRQAARRLEVDSGDHLDLLTEREVAVVALIARGLSNRQIAEELYLAEKTVKNYITNLLAKLGLSRRAEVVSLLARRNEQRRFRGEPPFGHDLPHFARLDHPGETGTTP